METTSIKAMHGISNYLTRRGFDILEEGSAHGKDHVVIIDCDEGDAAEARVLLGLPGEGPQPSRVAGPPCVWIEAVVFGRILSRFAPLFERAPPTTSMPTSVCAGADGAPGAPFSPFPPPLANNHRHAFRNGRFEIERQPAPTWTLDGVFLNWAFDLKVACYLLLFLHHFMHVGCFRPQSLDSEEKSRPSKVVGKSLRSTSEVFGRAGRLHRECRYLGVYLIEMISRDGFCR